MRGSLGALQPCFCVFMLLLNKTSIPMTWVLPHVLSQSATRTKSQEKWRRPCLVFHQAHLGHVPDRRVFSTEKPHNCPPGS